VLPSERRSHGQAGSERSDNEPRQSFGALGTEMHTVVLTEEDRPAPGIGQGLHEATFGRREGSGAIEEHDLGIAGREASISVLMASTRSWLFGIAK
jgi:hypothetical protein